MNKKDVFSKSLQANKDYVNSLTKEQLEEKMKFYDNYEIEQLNMHDVMCCVDYVDGITKGKTYKVIGHTNDNQMYVIDNDNSNYRCYGINLFKHNT